MTTFPPSIHRRTAAGLLFGFLVVLVIGLVGDMHQVSGRVLRFPWELYPLVLGVTLLNYASFRQVAYLYTTNWRCLDPTWWIGSGRSFDHPHVGTSSGVKRRFERDRYAINPFRNALVRRWLGIVGLANVPRFR